MAGTIEGIFHPVVGVSDMAAALRFWRDALGLRVTFDDYHDPAAIADLFGYPDPRVHSAVVSCPDGSEIELVEFEHPRGADSPRNAGDVGYFSLNFRVTDIDAVVSRVSEAGFRLTSNGIVDQVLPDGGVIRVAVIHGADDVIVILVQLPEGRASLAA
jgi:catechol 2,3-dioxygenase-like lactoylglutathione lyase family enzyme